MANALANIEPKEVWKNFEEICQYPHPSRKEDKLAAYIVSWAEKNNFTVEKDKTGNILISKPATPGMEDRKAIAIQGHIDMVCQKNSDTEFDFDNDPIQAYVDGDWVKAKGTTLGADNGIGVAMGMTIMESKDIPHPAFELLCTLDEETGLTGAMTLSDTFLKADILINLDSEEDGAFTIGCAGGINTDASFKYEADPVPAGMKAYEVAIKGLQGGHSGIEIHDGRANALKFLNRLLWTADKKFDLRIATFEGGNAHNAIPREAFATITVANDHTEGFEAFIKDFDQKIKVEYKSKEPGITAECAANDMPCRVMTKEFGRRLMNAFYVMPHGVHRMSPDINGLVQTSTNFSIVETRDDEIYIVTSQRSSVESEKYDLAAMVRISQELGGATVKHGDGYPAWEPNMDSAILKSAKQTYIDLFGKEPVIETIHAGLECGLIGEKYPKMDMLSFGPNLAEVHTPSEMIQISSTQKCWKLLLEIVNNIPKK